MKYLPVDVYTDNSGYDCTNNGITHTHPDKLVIPHERGFLSEEDIEQRGYIVLEKRVLGGAEHYARKGETRWTMFGGNFVYSSDSRFQGNPIKVHDRIEG